MDYSSTGDFYHTEIEARPSLNAKNCWVIAKEKITSLQEQTLSADPRRLNRACHPSLEAWGYYLSSMANHCHCLDGPGTLWGLPLCLLLQTNTHVQTRIHRCSETKGGHDNCGKGSADQRKFIFDIACVRAHLCVLILTLGSLQSCFDSCKYANV